MRFDVASSSTLGEILALKPLVLHLVCHLGPIQEGHQEAHLVRRAGERRLEDRLVAPREALLLDLFHQEVAQPVLRHHLRCKSRHIQSCRPS